MVVMAMVVVVVVAVMADAVPAVTEKNQGRGWSNSYIEPKQWNNMPWEE